MEDLRRARETAASRALSGALADAGAREEDVAAVTDALRGALDAAPDLAGRPLHAGLRALPWPQDPAGALWHAASLLREHRGDAHLGACLTAGLDAVEANVLTELRAGYPLLEYTASRGWSNEEMDAAVARLGERGLVADGALTDAGARLREQVEQATDRAQHRLVAALADPAGIAATVEPWADAVIARGAFPPDPYKRTAG